LMIVHIVDLNHQLNTPTTTRLAHGIMID